MTAINITVTIGGQQIQADKFSVVGGSYGSVGHAEIMTSRKYLNNAGIDLMALSSASPSYLPVTISLNTNNTPTLSVGNPLASLLQSAIPNSPTVSQGVTAAVTTPPSPTTSGTTQANVGLPNIFGGEYVSAKWNYDTDEVTIQCRDYAGVLVDQKRVLTSILRGAVSVLAPGQVSGNTGINVQNQTITNIVTAIANQFGLTPRIYLQSGNNPTIGSLYGNDDTVYTPLPQSLWSVLNRLALDLGYDVYVTPKKELVFGLPGIMQTPLKLSYNVPMPTTGTIPCLGLQVDHNPRRNSSFRVLVLSYDAGQAQLTTGRATAIGSNLGGTGNQQVQAGIWTGTNAQTVDSQFENAGTQIPVYTFHIDGLNQSQAQTRAIAIANDIQKREMLLRATIDGFPSIYPGQQISVGGAVDSSVIGKTFYVSKFQHTFTMPRRAGIGMDGFMTHIEALNVAVQGTGNPLKPLKQANSKR